MIPLTEFQTRKENYFLRDNFYVFGIFVVVYEQLFGRL